MTSPDDLEREIEPRFGDPVRLRCGATGRYLGRGTGLGLFVCAQDNDLGIDEIVLDGEPWDESPLPSLEACTAANVGLYHRGVQARAETLREVAVECALEHDAGGYVVVQMTAETWRELSAAREAPR